MYKYKNKAKTRQIYYFLCDFSIIFSEKSKRFKQNGKKVVISIKLSSITNKIYLEIHLLKKLNSPNINYSLFEVQDCSKVSEVLCKITNNHFINVEVWWNNLKFLIKVICMLELIKKIQISYDLRTNLDLKFDFYALNVIFLSSNQLEKQT